MFKLTHQFKGYQSDTLVLPPKTIEMTLDSDDVPIAELCEFFGDFLKACTYEFDGQIEVVNDIEDDFQALCDDIENGKLDSCFSNENAVTDDPSQMEFDFPEVEPNTEEIKE